MRPDKIAEILFYIVIGICILSVGKEIYRRAMAIGEYNRLGELIERDDHDITEDSGEEEIQADRDLPDKGDIYVTLGRINPEFVGILSIPELDLRYPVVQGTDNEKYLSTTFEGKENPAGCIFIDCENSRDLSDNVTFIYGHNMKDGTMFGSLKKLLKTDIGKNEIRAYIHTGDKEYEYSLSDVKVVDVDSIKNIRSKQREIILYTCWSNEHDKRLLTTFRSCL